MKEFTFRTILIIGAFALGIYLLYPTFADVENTKDINKKLAQISENIKVKDPSISESDLQKKITSARDSLMKADPSILKNREKRIKLGLDLQGGMYLVMEINTTKMLEKLAKNPDDVFAKCLQEADSETKVSEENVVSVLARKLKANGKRMSLYFDFGDIKASDSDIEDKLKQLEKDAVTRAVEIISKRVNQYGVSEPNIQTQGSRRIVLELPGVSNMEEARSLVQKGAVLEFKLFVKPQVAFALMQRIDQTLAGTDSVKAGSDSSKNATAEQFAKQHPFFKMAMIEDQSQKIADTYVSAENRDKLERIFERPDIKKMIDDAGAQFVFDSKPVVNKDGSFYKMYVLNAKPELTGDVVVNATAHIDQTDNKPVVNMEMNDDGTAEWARITGQNVGQRCAVVLDGVVYTAPYIQERISGGQSRISGSANME